MTCWERTVKATAFETANHYPSQYHGAPMLRWGQWSNFQMSVLNCDLQQMVTVMRKFYCCCYNYNIEWSKSYATHCTSVPQKVIKRGIIDVSDTEDEETCAQSLTVPDKAKAWCQAVFGNKHTVRLWKRHPLALADHTQLQQAKGNSHKL